MKFKVVFFICLFFITHFHSNAQDTLKLRDGTVSLVKILELSSTSIKYKKYENLGGPSYLVLISDVKTVCYENGKKEDFSKKENEQIVTPYRAPAPEQRHLDEEPRYIKKEVRKPYKKSGPRVGCTYIGEGTAFDYITGLGKQPFVSQLGWELELRIFTSESGIAAVTEFNFLFAGMEQGMFLPNSNILIGLRGPEGIEFMLGPNFSYYDKFSLGMEFSVGGTLQMNDVYFPVNLSFVPSIKKDETVVSYTGTKSSVKTETGFRLNLTIGFYSKKR